MLGWSQRDLAQSSGVAVRTIADFETDTRRPYNRTLKDLREVFERAGVEFLDAAEGKGVGAQIALCTF